MPEPRQRRLAMDKSTKDYPETVVPEDIQSRVENENLYSGQCVGGPMDRMEGQSRFPKGFILVDTANQMCWVYDYLSTIGEEGGGFHCRARDNFDTQRGEKAANESNYDVRAFDPETMKGPRGYHDEDPSR